MLFTWGHGYVATLVIREQLFPAANARPATSGLGDQGLEDAPLVKAA
jgi:hypothetical protein